MAERPDLFTPTLSDPRSRMRGLGSPARDDAELETLQMILREGKRFCAREVDSAAIDAREALGGDILQGVGSRGWFGLTIPESHGGAGLSLKAATQVVAALGSHNGSLATCIGLHSGLALYGLLHLAPPRLQEQYLPRIAAGSCIAAFAATEPGAGSDLGAIRTELTEVQGQLRLSGSKCYVTNGGLCGVLTVLASSPNLGGARSGHTLLVVDPSWPGVVRQREEKKLGLKGSSTITIDFENVLVPHDHILGVPSKGMEHAHAALTWGRTFMAAGCLGAAQGACQHALEYTADRRQFGRPLNRFPLVREQLASNIARVFAIESVIRLTCDLHDTRTSDIALESTVAKIVASEKTWDVIDQGLQLMGGMGYIEDAGMSRRLRDVRVTRIFEGANDVLRLHLASATLGWAAQALEKLVTIQSVLPSELSELGGVFDGLRERLVATLVRIRKTHGFRLFEQQGLQREMADAICPIYAMLAVLLRGAQDVGRHNGRAKHELAVAKLAATLLAREAQVHLCAAERGEDREVLDLLDDILAE